MFLFKKKHRADANEGSPEYSVPIVSVTLEQVKKAVEEFENSLPKGINRTVLIGDNNEIKFFLLVPFLKGMPDKSFFMSKEAYEIYPEEDRMIPYWLDIVQKAVDTYIEENKTLPLVPDDRNKKISCVLLQNNYYLKEKSPIDFYLTPYDNLISHRPH